MLFHELFRPVEFSLTEVHLSHTEHGEEGNWMILRVYLPLTLETFQEEVFRFPVLSAVRVSSRQVVHLREDGGVRLPPSALRVREQLCRERLGLFVVSPGPVDYGET